jgi:hypothetical protein
MDPEERLPALLRDLRRHHYRVSRTALAAADATVFELPGNSESWIHDDPGQPAPALVAAT